MIDNALNKSTKLNPQALYDVNCFVCELNFYFDEYSFNKII